MTVFMALTALVAWLGFAGICGMLFVGYLLMQGRRIL